MASKTERTIINAAGLAPGVVLVTSRGRAATADLIAVIAAHGRAQNLESAQHAAAQGREQMRRFLTQGVGYQPATVQMFH